MFSTDTSYSSKSGFNKAEYSQRLKETMPSFSREYGQIIGRDLKKGGAIGHVQARGLAYQVGITPPQLPGSVARAAYHATRLGGAVVKAKLTHSEKHTTEVKERTMKAKRSFKLVGEDFVKAPLFLAAAPLSSTVAPQLAVKIGDLGHRKPAQKLDYSQPDSDSTESSFDSDSSIPTSVRSGSPVDLSEGSNVAPEIDDVQEEQPLVQAQQANAASGSTVNKAYLIATTLLVAAGTLAYIALNVQSAWSGNSFFFASNSTFF